MKFRLLGAIEAWKDDSALPLGGAKPRTVLAALLLSGGQPLSVSRIIDTLWPEEPPKTAQALVHSYVATLRKVLRCGEHREVLQTRSRGYVIEPETIWLDLTEFERLVALGRAANAEERHEQGARLLRKSLELWRGAPLDNTCPGFAEPERVRLNELRLAVLAERFEAELAIGAEASAVGELAKLAAEHPLQDRFTSLLMTAHYRLGRQVEALEVYQGHRRQLLGLHGLEPAARLRELHRAILRSSEELLTPKRVKCGSRPSPAQLPPDIPHFTGRDPELARVINAVARPGLARPSLVMLTGQRCIGKTALAVHACHRVAEAFPDGQVYLDLSGVSAEEAIRRVLRAFDVSTFAASHSADEAAAHYRSFLRDRQVLLLVDNASDMSQVRALLPAAPGCAMVVTTSEHLHGLPDTTVHLGPLLPQDSLALLTKLIGTRDGTGPGVLEELAALCDHHPLALQAAASRLSSRPQWTVTRLVARLRDPGRRLAELSAGDPRVRAEPVAAYRALGECDGRMLAALAIADAPSYVPWMAAELGEISEAEAEDVLDRLADAYLLERDGFVYRMASLVRLAVAAEAWSDSREDMFRQAVARLCGRYAATIRQAVAAFGTGEVAMGDPAAWFRDHRARIEALTSTAIRLELLAKTDDPAAPLMTSFRTAPRSAAHWQADSGCRCLQHTRAGSGSEPGTSPLATPSLR
ncbi:AfsR/SARP family transcriptional regulator [Amycolatopsis decaplanina]|uniref:SARP family transcriptional regulator n=1 Tax=Amycolatopsis decaplanina DSM 44594 TaxID=1284240 RepID=M2YCH3_9PSEU|nr:BTAD domain-containing putative transcriptional regulator [Amycolatopsis decaplanina]EME52557.1 SARP family transcriptional regulator [Amycolatopsis decaplanina DSM 44594]